jgi:putative permease
MQTTDRSQYLRFQNRFKMIVFLIVLLIGGVALFWIKDLLLSFVLAIVISYLLSPWVSQLESAGLRRITASAIVFVSFFTITGLLIWAISPFLSAQITALQRDFPYYLDSLMQISQRFQNWAQGFLGDSMHLTFGDGFSDFIQSSSKEALLKLPTFLSSSASVLILSPFIGFFILRDGRDIARSLLGIIPNNAFEISVNLLHQINSQIGQYFRARILESCIVGTIVLAGLWIIGFKYAVVLALFAAITNLIPYIGPIVGAVPAVIIALTGQDPQLALFLSLSVYAVAQLVDVFFIVPLVVAKIVNLHPVTVVLAVIVGAQLLGVLGMLISIPIFSAIKVTSVAIYNHVTDFG